MDWKKTASKTWNILLVLLIVWMGYRYRDGFEQAWKIVQKKVGPCQKPIEYSIGSFDKRFGVSEEEFSKTVAEAAAVWGKALGRPLFVNAENGALKVSLIYDYRQEATVKMKSLGIDIDNSQASYDGLKARHDAMLASYAKDKAALERMIAGFDTRKKAYEQSVASWNKRGGAPEEVYNKLEQERLYLASQADAINSAQSGLNSLIEDINASVTVLNRLVNDLNLHVDRYNNVGEQVGREFQEGEYRIENGSEEINIYQFDDKTKLLRVLIHEFGHALGLEHVDDPKAIMYRLNEGMNDELALGDMEALKSICKAE